MADAEIEFGRRLRASVEGAATTAIDARLAQFGKSVSEWSERAARESVHALAHEATRPLHEGLARLKGEMELLATGVAGLAEMVQGVDAERLHNDYAEMHDAQGRLEKARGVVLAEIRAAATAVQENVTRAGALATSLTKARDDVASLAAALAVRIEAVRGDLRESADASARDAVAELQADLIATVEGAIEKVVEKREGTPLGWFRGPWGKAETYRSGDVTTDQGSTWLAKGQSTGERPSPRTGSAWALLASGGIHHG